VTAFDPLGFACHYDIVLDDEPGDEAGDLPHYCFGRDGRHIEEFEFEERWGTSLVVRIDPLAAPPWVGTFAAGGLGVVRGVYGTPSPRRVCVIVDGLAFLIGVGAPEQRAAIASDAVVNVTRVANPALLLLTSDDGLAAIGVDGVQWVVPRLVVDDLRVLRTSADAIVCSGNVGDRMATITISPESGVVWGSDYR